MQSAQNWIITFFAASLMGSPVLAAEASKAHEKRNTVAEARAEASAPAARSGHRTLRLDVLGEKVPSQHAGLMQVDHKGHGKHWKHKHHGHHKGLPPGHSRNYHGRVGEYHYVRSSGMIRLYGPWHHLHTSIPLEHGATWEIIDDSIYVYGAHHVRVYGGPHFHLIRTIDRHHYHHHEDSSVFFGIRF